MTSAGNSRDRVQSTDPRNALTVAGLAVSADAGARNRSHVSGAALAPARMADAATVAIALHDVKIRTPAEAAR